MPYTRRGPWSGPVPGHKLVEVKVAGKVTGWRCECHRRSWPADHWSKSEAVRRHRAHKEDVRP